MTSRNRLDAGYIQGSQGLWLMTRWRASNNSTALLILPPFAEEMNCCRRVFAQLAGQLTDTGIDCFLPDFFGTGDSEGEFSAISLQLWRQDMLDFLPQLAGYRQVHLLGCRFGAALLLDWLADIRQLVPAGKILLWQPQLDAKRFWQQLQRLQQFGEAGKQAGDLASNTNAAMAQAKADAFYVAGYAIPQQLQAEAAALQSKLPADVSQLHWFESTLTGQLAAASLKLQQNDAKLQMQALSGQPYWLSQEPVDTQALLDATVAALSDSQANCDRTNEAHNAAARIPADITANTTAPQIIPLQFNGQQSLGIYHAAMSDLLIVMVNGGAQTKAGSHRMQQQLASLWQQAGFASLRFDFPGFGDAAGEPGDFIDHARYLTELPTQLAHLFTGPRRLVLFGLCDGATAALLASPMLQPEALMLLNPWCRLQQNHARTMLKFYYLRRLVSKEFWQKVIRGQLNLKASFSALHRFLRSGAQKNQAEHSSPATGAIPPQLTPDQAVRQAIANWRQLAVTAQPTPLHLTLSGADLTAAECAELLKTAELQQLWQQTELLQIPGANHTLSGEGHCDLLMQATVAFMRKLPH